METTTIQLDVFEKGLGVLPVYYAYCTLGFFAFWANFFVIAMYISTRELRQQYVLHMGLAVADMANGVGFVFTGISRLQQTFKLQGLYTYPLVSRGECALQIGNIFQAIGSQWPALVTFALGVERYIAVTHPLRYRSLKTKFIKGFLMSTFVVSIIPIIVAVLFSAIVAPDEKVLFTCTLGNAYGSIYSTYNYFITTIGHVLGFLLNLFAYARVRKTVQKLGVYNNKMKQEYTKIKVMFLISILSLIMVVLPHIYWFTERYSHISTIMLGRIYCLFVLRSTFNVWVIGFALKDFRLLFYHIFLSRCFPQSMESVDDSRPDEIRIEERNNIQIVRIS